MGDLIFVGLFVAALAYLAWSLRDDGSNYPGSK